MAKQNICLVHEGARLNTPDFLSKCGSPGLRTEGHRLLACDCDGQFYPQAAEPLQC